MTDRRPIIVVAGEVRELAPPDTLPADIIPATSTGGKTFAFFMS